MPTPRETILAALHARLSALTASIGAALTAERTLGARPPGWARNAPALRAGGRVPVACRDGQVIPIRRNAHYSTADPLDRGGLAIARHLRC